MFKGLLFTVAFGLCAGSSASQLDGSATTSDPASARGESDVPVPATLGGAEASAEGVAKPGPSGLLPTATTGAALPVAADGDTMPLPATAHDNPHSGGVALSGPGCDQVDQSQLTSNTCMAYFSQTDLAQSFITTADTLCGARIDLYPGTGGATVKIALWDGLPNAGGTLLASGSDFNVPDGGSAIVDFGSVPVVPGDLYFLVFTASNGNPCIAGNTNDPYPGGHVYANNGYNPFPSFDYTFETYGNPAPLPGPIDQSQLSTNTCMAYFSQTDLAQSFTTTATSLCGARVDLFPGTGGADVTIGLWNGLPNAGGSLLASGTDFDVPDGGFARVAFGCVPVTPGDEYFLVFTANNGNPCIRGDTDDPYSGGHVYANGGYDPFPDFDYTFETYGPQVFACGGPDQTQGRINTCMAYFSQTNLAQSFTPNAAALCGASIELWPGTGSADVTIGLWTALPNAGGTLLAFGTDDNVPDGGTALVEFGGSIPVQPGLQYFLVFSATNGNPCIAGDTDNPYPGGRVYANPGYDPFPNFDYTFRTYGENTDACGPPDQSSLTQTHCMASAAQSDLAQSFTAGTSSICGARVDLWDGSGGGDITIELWDALPDEGGTLLASGTDPGIPDGGAAIVDFGGSIPVTPGVRYFLVFTATNGNPCIAGSIENPLPGGHVYANSGYNPFPQYDYTFETYAGEGCVGDCGTQDGVIDVLDLLALLGGWGGPGACDFDGSGVTDVLDLLVLLGAWGPCIQ